MSRDPYSVGVRTRFAAPRYAGQATGVSILRESPDARIELSAEVEGATIVKMRFLAWGCPHVVAACDFACEQLEGGSVSDSSKLDAASIIETLAVPIEKTGRILLLEDALADLSSAIARES